MMFTAPASIAARNGIRWYLIVTASYVMSASPPAPSPGQCFTVASTEPGLSSGPPWSPATSARTCAAATSAFSPLPSWMRG